MDRFEQERDRVLKHFEESGNLSETDESEPEPFSGGSDVDPDYVPEDSSQDDDDDDEENVRVRENPIVLCEDGGDVGDAENTETEEWKDDTTVVPDFNFDKTNMGIQVCIEGNATPTEVFEILLTNDVLTMLVDSTNEYGKKLCSTDRPKLRYSRCAVFKEVDTDEIKKFLGLCFLQAQIRAPKIRSLFSSDPLYQHPVFGKTMSGRRFEQILRCFNIRISGEKDKCKNINQLTKLFCQKFRSIYKPEQSLSLDESLLLFKGRLHFKQYIPSKRGRYGIKFFELCDPAGYVFNIDMYQGKTVDIEDGQTASSSKIDKLVMKLMDPYLYKGHILCMDNFYNSMKLSETLLSYRTHTIGTLRKNRKNNPHEIINRNLKKGEYIWKRRGKIYVSKWKDTRDVLFINTFIHPKMQTVQNSRGKQKSKPAEIAFYNDNMAGVDRTDQIISYYSIPRKTIRWYKKVLFHLLDVTLFNSYFIYKKRFNKKNLTFLEFRDSIIRDFLGISRAISSSSHARPSSSSPYARPSSAPGPSSSSCVPSTSSYGIPNADVASLHIPERITRCDKAGERVYRRCRQCTKRKNRKETSIQCQGCVDKPPLCLDCFETWHNNLQQ